MIGMSWFNGLVACVSSVILYISTFLSLVYSGLLKGTSRLFLICSFCSLTVFLMAFPAINNIELWADEVFVIKYADALLNPSHYSTYHKFGGLTPLEQLTVYLWQSTVHNISKEYMEFTYRIPPMIFHSLAAFFFTLGIAYLLKFHLPPIRKKHWALLILCFSLFFFNPLLFIYSMELRNYSFSILGVCVLIVVFLKNKVSTAAAIPTLLLPGLNFIFHFFILIPTVLISCFQNKRLVFHHILLLVLIVFYFKQVIDYSKIPSWYYANSNYMSIDIHHGIYLLKEYITKIFGTEKLSIIMILTSLFIMYHVRTIIHKSTFMKLAILLIISLVSITATGLLIKYPFFTTRHFIIATPLVLMIILYPLILINNKSLHWSIIVMLGCLVLWIYSDIQMLATGKPFNKSLMGTKLVLSIAEKEDRKIIFNAGDLPIDLRNYYIMSFNWYKNNYPSINIIEEPDITNAIQTYNKTPQSILYVLSPGASLNALLPIGKTTIFKNVFIAYR